MQCVAVVASRWFQTFCSNSSDVCWHKNSFFFQRDGLDWHSPAPVWYGIRWSHLIPAFSSGHEQCVKRHHSNKREIDRLATVQSPGWSDPWFGVIDREMENTHLCGSYSDRNIPIINTIVCSINLNLNKGSIPSLVTRGTAVLGEMAWLAAFGQ